MTRKELKARIKEIRAKRAQAKEEGQNNEGKALTIKQKIEQLKQSIQCEENSASPAKKISISTRKGRATVGDSAVSSISGSINGSSCITLETWDYNGNLISDYYGYVSDYDGCFVCLGIDMGYISNY
ncbi:MAG: hypothetical protein J6X29_03710, partial [Clostridia bacterium]|nr:hypothetical protein [Clostridia bacterium]